MKRDALPDFDGADVRAMLDDMSRAPFRDALADLLAARPDHESLADFARKHPDRWAQSVAIFARGAGYSDRIRVDASVSARLPDMSDSEVMERIAELMPLIGRAGIKDGQT